MQSLNEIRENVFIGMNDRFPADQLDPGLFALLQNVTIDQQSLSKRKGTTAVASTLGSFSILGLNAFEPVAGTKYLFALLNGSSNAQLYKWSGSGSFSTVGTANITKDSQMNFVQASNVLYGFNGTDVISVDSSLTYTKNPSSVPKGMVAAWFHNYLFVANTSSFPNRLFFSNLGDPTTFSGTDFIDINPNDGDQITALAIFNDELYVFKNNTIWTITGFSGSSFSTTATLSQNTNNKIYGYGTPSQKSVVTAGKDMYYLSFAGGIPHFRSFIQTQFASTLEQGIISFDIEGTLNTLNLSQLSLCAGAYDGKYIYWSVPTGSSNHNDTVLVLEPTIKTKGKTMTHRCWAKWTGFNAAQFAVSNLAGENVIYFGDGTATGLVYQLNTASFTDNGTAVTMDVKTRNYFYDLSRKAKYKYIYTTFTSDSAASVSLNARLDEALNFTTQATISQQGDSPGLGSFILGTSTLGGQDQSTVRTIFQHLTGHKLQIEFKDTTSSSVEIRHWQIFGKPKGLRGD